MALAAAAAFTLLNPHVYIDTVMLMGAVGSSRIGAASGGHGDLGAYLKVVYALGSMPCSATSPWLRSRLGGKARLAARMAGPEAGGIDEDQKSQLTPSQ